MPATFMYYLFICVETHCRNFYYAALDIVTPVILKFHCSENSTFLLAVNVTPSVFKLLLLLTFYATFDHLSYSNI
jgi:hypothetical protein